MIFGTATNIRSYMIKFKIEKYNITLTSDEKGGYLTVNIWNGEFIAGMRFNKNTHVNDAGDFEQKVATFLVDNCWEVK